MEAVVSGRERSPRGMDLTAVHKELRAVPGVASHHDLHVWSISSEHVALSVHVVVKEQTLAESEQVMRDLESRVCERFSIGHTTIQLEFCQPCAAEADHLLEHNHPHAKLARLATTARRRTPLWRRKPKTATR